MDNQIGNDMIQAALQQIQEEIRSIKKDLSIRNQEIEGWVPETEAERILGIGKSTLYAYRRKGKLTFSKVGRKIFYKHKDLKRLLDQNEM